MPHGTVKRVERALGFGFLVDEAGMDWFFVSDGVRGGLSSLLVGDVVHFTPEWTAKGPRASDIALDFPQPIH